VIRGRLRPLDQSTYQARGLDPDKVSLRDTALLLGIYYEMVLRYMHELLQDGEIEVARKGNQYFLDSQAVEAIRQRHQSRKDYEVAKYQEEPNRDRILAYVRQFTAKAEDLKQQALEVLREVEKPGPVSTWIASVPGIGLRMKSHIPVLVEAAKGGFVASAPDLDLDALGKTRPKAVTALRFRIAADFFYLLQKGRDAAEEARLSELRQYISDEEERAAPVKSKRPAKPHPKKAKISVLWMSRGLSTRAANALAFSGIETPEELRAARKETRLRLPHLGKKSRAEVEAYLKRHGADEDLKRRPRRRPQEIERGGHAEIKEEERNAQVE